MSPYTVLGWIVWRFGKPMLRRELARDRTKLGAVGVIALVVLGGILAARSGDE